MRNWRREQLLNVSELTFLAHAAVHKLLSGVRPTRSEYRALRQVIDGYRYVKAAVSQEGKGNG